MEIADIIRLMESVKSNAIGVLEVNEGNLRVRIEREAAPLIQTVQSGAAPQAAAVPAKEAAAPANDYKVLESPLVGIFHPVDESKGVKIGAQLKKGTVVCIVEAMKLMNEITMPEDGELVWVAAKDGDAVEYGQTLFQYK